MLCHFLNVWNGILFSNVLTNVVHVWYQMKAYMCETWKQSIPESKAYKHAKRICFCRPDVHFHWEPLKSKYKFGRTKVSKAEEVRKYFVNPKMKVFGFCINFIICSLDFRYTEAVVRRFSSEQTLLKISQCWSFFLIKLQAFRHAILLKRDFSIGAFLRNLQNL